MNALLVLIDIIVFTGLGCAIGYSLAKWQHYRSMAQICAQIRAELEAEARHALREEQRQ